MRISAGYPRNEISSLYIVLFSWHSFALGIYLYITGRGVEVCSKKNKHVSFLFTLVFVSKINTLNNIYYTSILFEIYYTCLSAGLNPMSHRVSLCWRFIRELPIKLHDSHAQVCRSARDFSTRRFISFVESDPDLRKEACSAAQIYIRISTAVKNRRRNLIFELSSISKQH